MSNSQGFRCPVCRARQSLQASCRRCQADLSLVMRAHQRVAYLLRSYQAARLCGARDHQQRIVAELELLAPSQLEGTSGHDAEKS